MHCSKRRAQTSFDHPVNAQQNGRRDSEAQSFRALEVDHEFEFDRLLNGQVTQLGTLEYLVHVGGTAPAIFRVIRAVGDDASRFCVFRLFIFPPSWPQFLRKTGARFSANAQSK